MDKFTLWFDSVLHALNRVNTKTNILSTTFELSLSEQTWYTIDVFTFIFHQMKWSANVILHGFILSDMISGHSIVDDKHNIQYCTCKLPFMSNDVGYSDAPSTKSKSNTLLMDIPHPEQSRTVITEVCSYCFSKRTSLKSTQEANSATNSVGFKMPRCSKK